MGNNHPHTWEVILNVMKITDNFVLFDEIEKICEEFLSHYQDVNINQTQPFTTINPTLENLCTYFKDKLREMLHEKGWLLLSIELSETPARSYVINVTDEMEDKKSYFNSRSEETMQEIIDRMTTKKIESMSKGRTSSAELAAQQEKEFRQIEKKVTTPGERVWRKLTKKKLFK